MKYICGKGGNLMTSFAGCDGCSNGDCGKLLKIMTNLPAAQQDVKLANIRKRSVKSEYPRHVVNPQIDRWVLHEPDNPEKLRNI
jgi:hypothetical protein